MEDTIIFENKDNFDVLLITPTNIDNLDWKQMNYTDLITELNIYSIITTDPTTFSNVVYQNLITEKFIEKAATTQIILECPEYIYELVYVEQLTDKDAELNGVATLLNTNGEKIYGNVLLLKSFISSDSNSMLLNNCNISDIKLILNNRVNINIVLYDGEWSNKVIFGNLNTIEEFANSYFDDIYKKFECGFLLHNINIWYELCDGCSKSTCGSILEKPIYKCIWFSKLTDNYLTSIYLDEVKRIINLSLKLDFPYRVKDEWVKEEIDEYKRKIVKNKYKILKIAENNL